MKISKILLTGLMIISSAWLFGQSKTVTGTVTAEDSGETLPGATVVVKGTTSGVVSDIDGKFSIETEVGNVLVVSFIGMQDREVTVGQANTYNVMLKTGIDLDEFVVTALGITRDKKSLGYATQQVSGDEVNRVSTPNFVNNLAGKIAGVQIQQSGNIGGSSNVIIRGYSSIQGDNQALFVIDGVPMSNQNVNTAYQQRGGKGFDYGNAISDIDPDNIESINVLKGAAATALYGSRAANGVVMITTKKGQDMKGKKKIGVTINSSVQLGWADRTTFIEHQKEYGAGYEPGYGDVNPYFYDYDIDGDGNDDLVVPFTEDGSYGARFDPNLMVYHWDSFVPESPYYKKARPWVFPENDAFSFFETQTSYDNNIALYGGSEKGTFRMSYGRLDQTGILPNSSQIRNNVSITGDMNLTDKVKVAASANYVSSETVGRNSTGYSGNIMSMFRQWWQTNVDVKEMEELYDLTGRNITWNPSDVDDPTPLYWDNPYWQRYENYTNDRKDRLYGYARASWEITNWFSLEGQASLDNYSLLIEERLAQGSAANPFGVGLNEVGSGYSRQNVNATEMNLDLFARFKKDLSADLDLTGMIGTNVRRNTYNSVSMNTSGGLVVPNVYALSNSVNASLEAAETLNKNGVNGVFANASLGYKRFLYLDVSLRNDWASTLPSGENSYLYPAVSGSFIFSELIDNADWMDLGKIRLNYAEVGSDAPVHSIKETYTANIPYNSPLYSMPIRRNNPELKPERSKSLEGGLNMEFFKRRLGFDLAVYKNNTIDGIIPVSVSRASGYSTFYVNAAEVENRGIELQLYGSPVVTENFAWNINVNWTKNVSEVISLYNDVDNIQINSFQGGISVNARVGEPYGTILGTDYVYKNGERVVGTNGKYKISTNNNNVLGSIIPDWIAGITNTFTYKSWTLGAHIDWQKGGQIFSLDHNYGMATGLYPATSFTNDNGKPVRNTIAEGGGVVLDGVTATGEPNTVVGDASNYRFFGYTNNPNAAFMYDATYVKLREVSLSYRMPASTLANTFLSGVTFSLVGNNLWIIAKDLPHADPEAGQSSGNSQGWQSGALPTVRTVSFSVKLDF